MVSRTHRAHPSSAAAGAHLVCTCCRGNEVSFVSTTRDAALERRRALTTSGKAANLSQGTVSGGRIRSAVDRRRPSPPNTAGLGRRNKPSSQKASFNLSRSSLPITASQHPLPMVQPMRVCGSTKSRSKVGSIASSASSAGFRPAARVRFHRPGPAPHPHRAGLRSASAHSRTGLGSSPRHAGVVRLVRL